MKVKGRHKREFGDAEVRVHRHTALLKGLQDFSSPEVPPPLSPARERVRFHIARLSPSYDYVVALRGVQYNLFRFKECFMSKINCIQSGACCYTLVAAL